MCRKCGAWHLFLSLWLFIGLGASAQSLSYSGTNSFNISAPTHLNAVNIPMLERTPTGMAFGDSGTKFYAIGTSGDFVVQYTLSTAYDVSTRGTIQAYYRVNADETAPEDVTFNDTGTRMYILGGSGDDVTQYTLSSAWDVSTAGSPVVWDTRTAIENLLGATNGDRLTGMAFNNNGSKVYVVDRRSDDIFEFDLSTNYDISTASAVINNIPTTGESNPRAIAFNDDGTELYFIGNQGDDINVIPLSIAYDLSSSGTYTNHALPSSPDATPQALLINNAGTRFWVAGSTNDQIYEYTLNTAFDFNSTITFVESSGFPTVEIAPHGITFNSDGTKVFVAGDQANAVAEIALSTPYDLTTARYTAGLYVNSEQTQIRGLAFNATGTTLYIIGNQNDEIDGYDLSVAYDLTSTITTTTGSPWSITLEDDNPSDLFFNNDGTKLYVMGNTGNDINQYSLSPAYDMTDAIAANLDVVFELDGGSGLNIDTAPLGGTFNDDGTKLYIAGNVGNDVSEITLSNAYDLSMGTITNTATYSVNSEESTITDVAFSTDGSRFFIVGTNGDDMNQYQTKGDLPETSANNGTIDVTTPLVITLTGDTFADVDADNLLDETTEYTITNLPAGLTPVFTLTGGDTVATLTFTGKADSHINSDDVANLVFTFLDAAFTSSNAADVSLAVGHTNVMGIDFIECPSNEIVYNGSWSGGSGPGGAPDETDDASGIRISADVTITANFDCDCLHVDSGFTLATATGVQATVINALELEGDLRLLGTSQLIQTHTDTKNVSGTGNLYKDRMGTLSNVYQIGYWTSPVTTNGSTYTISGVLRDGTTALTASNTPGTITYTDDLDGNTSPFTLSRRWFASFLDNSIWTEEIGETAALNPGEGFTKKSTGAALGQNYTFLGRPNDGDYTFTIGSFGSGRWSLLGNPYPSPIDADQFITDNAVTVTSIEGTLYFYEAGNDTSHTTSEYTGGYASRVVGMGNPAAELGMSGKTPGQYIGIGQGFFIEASSTGGTVTFDNALRVFDPSDTNTEYFGRPSSQRSATTDFPKLRLGFQFDLDGDIYHRQVSIGFRGLTNNHESGYDAEMWDYKSSDLALKIDDRTAPYAIAGIEDFNNSLEIPLMLRLDQERAVTFLVDETEQLTTDIYIKDAVTNFYYNITNSSQEITMPAGTYNDRFFITFDNGTLSNDDPILDSQLLVYTKNEELIVQSNTLEILNVSTYSMLGQELEQYKNNALLKGEVILPIEKYATGVYILKIKTNKGIVSKKIVIN